MMTVRCMMMMMRMLLVVRMTDHWKMSMDGVILNTSHTHTLAVDGTTHQSTQTQQRTIRTHKHSFYKLQKSDL